MAMPIAVTSFYRVPKIRDKIPKEFENVIGCDVVDFNSNDLNLKRLKNVEVRVEKLNFVGLSSFMVKILFGKQCRVKLRKLNLNDVNLKVIKSIDNAKKVRFDNYSEDEGNKKRISGQHSVAFAGDSEVNLINDLNHIKQLSSPFKSVNGDVVSFIQELCFHTHCDKRLVTYLLSLHFKESVDLSPKKIFL